MIHDDLEKLLNELNTTNREKFVAMFSLPSCPPCKVFKSILQTKAPDNSWVIAEFGKDIAIEEWKRMAIPLSVPQFFIKRQVSWDRVGGNEAMKYILEIPEAEIV